jgi:hypothetical protein
LVKKLLLKFFDADPYLESGIFLILDAGLEVEKIRIRDPG